MSDTFKPGEDCFAPGVCRFHDSCRRPDSECGVDSSEHLCSPAAEMQRRPKAERPRSPDTRDALLDKGTDGPWPLRDVIEKLTEAATILLDEKDYDGHGWELIAGCRDRAREILGIPVSERSERSG